MSVGQHKDAAEGHKATVQVVVVSSTRTAETDESGVILTGLLEGAGHRVTARHVVDDDVRAIRKVVGDAGTDGKTNVVILTGGTGVSRRDVTPDAVEPLFDSPIPGFGELFRLLSFQEIGTAAMLSRATAGMMGNLLIFALPGSKAAVKLAAEKLLLPELPHLLRELAKEPAPGKHVESDFATYPFPEAEAEAEAEPEIVEPEIVGPDEGKLPPPSGKLGVVGRGKLAVLSEEVVRIDGVTPGGAERPVPPTGWRRAVYELGGEVLHDKREELPWDLESIAPVVDVLHSAGEVGVLQLPNGTKYGIYGWPDLRRDNSRVLAVGWGQPNGEILALHRFPHVTGTCIVEERGMAPKRGESIVATTERVTGQAPKDTSGDLFAVQADAVWIQRGAQVVKWDGRRESQDGTPKQVIATLVLHWSSR